MNEIRDRWDILTRGEDGREGVVDDGNLSGYQGYPTAEAALQRARSLSWPAGKEWAVARGDLSEIAFRSWYQQ